MIKSCPGITGAFRKFVPPYEPFPRFHLLHKPDPKQRKIEGDRSDPDHRCNRSCDHLGDFSDIDASRLPSWTIGPSRRSVARRPPQQSTPLHRSNITLKTHSNRTPTAKLGGGRTSRKKAGGREVCLCVFVSGECSGQETSRRVPSDFRSRRVDYEADAGTNPGDRSAPSLEPIAGVF
ncbi:hypothetical protein LXL04_032556 [Taraxacum kok-saghyz]